MSPTTPENEGFQGWAILELMGRRKLGGFVTVDPAEFPGMIRIDVHGDGPIATQYVARGSLYAMTPSTEAVARALAQRCTIAPVTAWEIRQPAIEHQSTSEDHVDRYDEDRVPWE